VNNVEFDPGFSKYVQTFSVNIGYIYNEFKRFKVFSQKQFQFQRFYATIRTLLDKQVAFSLGCLLWAIYLKSLDNSEIINNHCFGIELSEADYCYETNFTIDYLEQIKKDTKYYLNLGYDAPQLYFDILQKYKEFILLNEGFINLKYTSEIKLPDLKTLNDEDIKLIKSTIDSVVSDGDLIKLLDIANVIL